MQPPNIPHDDLEDVMEMANKMELFISDIFDENETNLAISALMSTTINCILEQCYTLDEVVSYRNIFMKMFESSIRDIRIKRIE